MSDSGASHIETLVIDQRKISRNSNGHNFSLRCTIHAHHISRRSKLNNGSYREIQMVITIHSDVRLRHITYRDARNRTTEALEKFIWFNYSNGPPIRAHNMSRRSKLNNRSSREIQIVITFQSDARFRRITYRDVRN